MERQHAKAESERQRISETLDRERRDMIIERVTTTAMMRGLEATLEKEKVAVAEKIREAEVTWRTGA